MRQYSRKRSVLFPGGTLAPEVKPHHKGRDWTLLVFCPGTLHSATCLAQALDNSLWFAYNLPPPGAKGLGLRWAWAGSAHALRQAATADSARGTLPRGPGDGRWPLGVCISRAWTPGCSSTSAPGLTWTMALRQTQEKEQHRSVCGWRHRGMEGVSGCSVQAQGHVSFHGSGGAAPPGWTFIRASLLFTVSREPPVCSALPGRGLSTCFSPSLGGSLTAVTKLRLCASDSHGPVPSPGLPAQPWPSSCPKQAPQLHQMKPNS